MRKSRLRLSLFLFLAILVISRMKITVQADNLTYASGVTAEMCKSDYWKDTSVLGADRILAQASNVKAYNDMAYAASGTGIYGIDRKALNSKTFIAKNRLSNDFGRDLYIDEMKINIDEYYENMRTQYEATSYPENSTQNYKYGIVVSRCDLWNWPTEDLIGYSSTDYDNENELSALTVNEPILIMQECVVDGISYYWGLSENCSGWILASKVALCKDANEWLSAWQFDLNGKDFLVVTQDKITLEASLTNAYSSKVLLDLGCALPLVPEEEWDEATSQLAERGTWNNYVVYLPTRGEDGSYIRKCALISQHYSVSIGYLDVTEANILDAAFSCLGNRYGWGGMLEAVDCSFYVRNIYRCFGYTLPRNTTQQPKVTGYSTDVSAMSDQEKAEYLSTIPIGSLLYFSGHVFMYTGTVDGQSYSISATGSLSDSTGEVNVQSMYSIILNPLSVRRRSGNSWLSELMTVVTFSDLRHKNHVLVEDPAKEANCQTTGLTAGSHCDLCGKVVTEQNEIPKTEHKWDAGSVVYSFGLAGRKVIRYTCTLCNYQKVEVDSKAVVLCKSLILSGISHEISAGKIILINAAISPSTATIQKLKWTSSNNKIATVNQNGKVSIKNKTGGKSVIIMATTTDGSNISTPYLIKVKKGVVKKVTVKGKKTVTAGKTVKLSSKVKSTKGANRILKWTSSNSDYATVNAKGFVKAKSAGKGKMVKITATSTDGSNKKASINIIIK